MNLNPMNPMNPMTVRPLTIRGGRSYVADDRAMTMENSPNGALTTRISWSRSTRTTRKSSSIGVGRLRYTEASFYTQRGHVDVRVRQDPSRRDHLAAGEQGYDPDSI